MPYINAEDILAARQIDLLSYLQTHEPGELVKLPGNNYCTREHDSLKISNGKWHWFSRGIGGRTALDYLVKVKEMSFPDAVRLLTGAPIQTYVPPKEHAAPKERNLLLPEVDTNCDEVKKYLQGRGIHPLSLTTVSRISSSFRQSITRTPCSSGMTIPASRDTAHYEVPLVLTNPKPPAAISGILFRLWLTLRRIPFMFSSQQSIC